MVRTSVILPAYNEAHGLAASLRRLVAFLDSRGAAVPFAPWELIVVDDGSTDTTAEEAARAAAADPRVRVVRLKSNAGKGAAVAAGIREARGDYLLVTDVDLSYALEDLASLLRTLAGPARGGLAPDVVAGDRRHPDSRLDLRLAALGHVARRQALSWAFNLLLARLWFGLPFRDTQCGLKGFTREAAMRIVPLLRTSRFLADIEIFLIARGRGMRVETIPVHLTYLSGESTVRVAREFLSVAADAFRIRATLASGGYRAPATPPEG